MKLIAETAAHHEGDFDFMMELCKRIASSSADVAKIHVTMDLDEYMTTDHSVYPLVKKWLFSKNQWDEIVSSLQSAGKELMMLTNDTKAVDYSKRNQSPYIEIHSVALNDMNLLSAAKEAAVDGTRIVLGVGGSTLEEIDNALRYVDSKNTILMFGFQNYPTKYSDINFRKIRRIMNLYPDHQFGYADHCGWDEPNNMLVTMLGASLGMSFLEKHVSHVPGEKRADAAAVVSFEYLEELKNNIKVLEACEGNGSLLLNEGERKYCVFGSMKKAAVLIKPVQAGCVIDFENMSFKRTAVVSDLSQLEVLQLLGRKINKNLPVGHVISRIDFE